MSLPDGVQKVVKPSGRTYYYFAPGRGTKAAGKRVPLGRDPQDPEFWRLLRDAKVGAEKVRAGSFSALIADFKASHEWGRLRRASRRTYKFCLNRLESEAGDRIVREMTRRDVYLLRDGMSGTPVAANLMLTVLRVLIEWGIPRGYRDDNPTVGLRRLVIEESGAQPWSEEAYAFVIDKAPPNLRRMAFLGRATGQRASDLVRMRPADLADDGINVRIGKRRDKPHFVPLTKAQVKEIRSWGGARSRLLPHLGVGQAMHRALSQPALGHLARRTGSGAAQRRQADCARVTRHCRCRPAPRWHRGRCYCRRDRHVGGHGDALRALADKAASARASRDRREQAETRFENSVTPLKTEGR